MFKKVGSVVVAIAILGGLGAVIWWQFDATTEQRAKAARRKANAKEEATLVEVVTVSRSSIKETLELTGTAAPQAQATVFSMVPGVVERLKVKEGEQVEKGQVLARLEGYKMVLAIQAARSGRTLAKVNLTRMTTTYKRMKALYKAKALPKAQFEQVEAGYKAAQAQLQQARVGVQMAGSRLSDAIIRAPISGVVLKKLVEQGDLMTAAAMMKSSPLLVIADLSSVKIKVAVAETDLGKVRIGQIAEVTVDAYPGKRFRGKVSEVAEMVDPMTRTIQVTVLVPNSEMTLQTTHGKITRKRPLKVGMFARVKLTVSEHRDALVIPNDAVLGRGRQRHVFVIAGGLAAHRKVRIGLRAGNRAEVVSGLIVGDQLIVLGHRAIRSGQAVRSGKFPPRQNRSGATSTGSAAKEPIATPVDKVDQ